MAWIEKGHEIAIFILHTTKAVTSRIELPPHFFFFLSLRLTLVAPAIKKQV